MLEYHSRKFHFCLIKYQALILNTDVLEWAVKGLHTDAAPHGFEKLALDIFYQLNIGMIIYIIIRSLFQ